MAVLELTRYGGRQRAWRLRCAACFARFPQTAMLHQRRARLWVLSRNNRVHVGPSHDFTWTKSSLQTSSAIARAMGIKRLSGERQRRIERQTNGDRVRGLSFRSALTI